MRTSRLLLMSVIVLLVAPFGVYGEQIHQEDAAKSTEENSGEDIKTVMSITVAIMDFESKAPGNPELGQQLGDILTARMSVYDQFQLVERKKMEELLKREYDWQDYKDYGPNQWRMGDGQTAFTNYIFHAVAGFSEFDNFRSNQVREGLISRDQALRLAEMDNQPKYEVLRYFSYLVGFNLDEVLAKIEAIPKLY